MEIILLRHGEVKENRDGKLSVDYSTPLTDTGTFQSQSICAELQKIKIDSVLVSPLPRAIKTIEPYCIASGIKMSIIPELSEGHLMLHEHVNPEKPEYIEKQGIGRVPIATESDGQFFSRASIAIQIILNQNSNRTLVVSHGHMIRELLNQLLGTIKRVRFPHGNCHATSITVEDHMMVNHLNRNYALTS